LRLSPVVNGTPMILEESPDLRNWQAVSTNVIGSRPGTILNQSVNDPPTRFFRLRSIR
jgi:hypothetical protein